MGMDLVQAKKILKRIQSCEADADALRAVRTKLGTAEYASATMSSGGGSRSYTRADLGKITTLINDLEREIKKLRKMLATNGNGNSLWSTVTLVYS